MTQIFIEARYEKTSEYVFLNTIIKELGFSEEQYKIICVGGNSNLVKAANKFKENTIEGGKNLIIFDADTPATGYGFSATLQRINQELQSNGMQADGIFLFPNNTVGKWFTPVIGLRAGFGGYQAKGYSVKDAGFAYKRVDTNLYRTKWGILHLHGDVMLNFTNLFCGYREDRLYNAIPYVSIGYLRGIDNNENELSGGIGFINRFRLNKAWDLNLELKGNINNDVMDGIRGGKNMEGSAAIMVGATYRFNRRDWTKGTGISAAEMQAVQNQLKSMNEENASLRNRVNALEEEKRNQPVVTETKASNKLPDATEYVAFFDINKAYLSEKEAVNLEAYANLIKKYSENKFIITGYADKQTGSAEFNERLSKLRAEAVYNTLVDKYGVNKDQLTMEYKGGVDTMFRENPRLSRAAIIRMAK